MYNINAMLPRIATYLPIRVGGVLGYHVAMLAAMMFRA